MLRSKDCELLQGVTSPNSVSDNFLFQKNNNNNNNLKTQKMSSTILSSNMLVAGNNNNGMISESKDSHAIAPFSKFANGNTSKHAFSTISSDGSITSTSSSSPKLSSSDKKRGWTLVKGKDGKLHKRRRREKWNDHEHDLFIEGMKRFKRNWSMIAKHVGTKSAVQVRTHAYSHFNRRVLNNSGNVPTDIIKKVWKNNIEEIPRDPFEILQQNEALASRQLQANEGLSPKSASKAVKKQRLAAKRQIGNSNSVNIKKKYQRKKRGNTTKTSHSNNKISSLHTSLKPLAEGILGNPTISYEDMIGKLSTKSFDNKYYYTYGYCCYELNSDEEDNVNIDLSELWDDSDSNKDNLDSANAIDGMINEEKRMELLNKARKRRFDKWYYSKSFPPYPVCIPNYGITSMASRLQKSLLY